MFSYALFIDIEPVPMLGLALDCFVLIGYYFLVFFLLSVSIYNYYLFTELYSDNKPLVIILSCSFW